jgi:hypothetical protein
MGGNQGMGGFGGGQQRPNTTALTRTVRGLAMVEMAQGAALTSQQRARIAPVLAQVQKANPMTEEMAEQLNEKLQAALSEEQRTVLTQLTPTRGRGGFGGGGMGGRGGGPPRPGGGPGGGGPPGGGMPGMGMGGPGGPGGMGGARVNNDRPFAEGPNRENLERLMKGN